MDSPQDTPVQRMSQTPGEKKKGAENPSGKGASTSPIKKKPRFDDELRDNWNGPVRGARLDWLT